ncbi:MAG TPA: adenosylhomocysteinase [Acidimicrobiia bacterium]|nr:adenosylhomocysteinase [Acidimicrobiia bacterium]HLF60416.1 adenosylhomocysteinase [Acidimicrobiia bacterium]
MNYDIVNPDLAEPGARRIAWAGRRMPVLATVRERFLKETPLEGLVVAACLHVTAETANLMLALRDGGAEPILCASNPLSTQDDVAAALVADGIAVFAIRGEDSDTYYKHINAVLDHAPAITMDDGADLATILHTDRRDLQVIGSTEETTTGVIRLRAMAADGTLRVPVVAVNESATKHLFDNHYGTGQSALDGILRATNVLLAGSTLVVVGYGDCGRGVAMRADGMGAKVVVVEVDPVRALTACMDGYRVMTSDDAAREGDIFITVTGNKHVIRRHHFDLMKDGAILANAGHFDIEIELDALAQMSVARREVRTNLEEFELVDGRRLLVAAEGRLVNLGAAEGHPADVMDMSFANQALAAEYLVLNQDTLEPAIHTLPPEIDRDVARIKLEHLGGGLEVLTDEQVSYLTDWREGT